MGSHLLKTGSRMWMSANLAQKTGLCTASWAENTCPADAEDEARVDKRETAKGAYLLKKRPTGARHSTNLLELSLSEIVTLVLEG